MKIKRIRFLAFAILIISVVLSNSAALAQTVNVTGDISFSMASNRKSEKVDNSNVVVWLRPVPGTMTREYETRLAQSRARFRLIQQRKRFDPHVLVVPLGSVVDFPNLDPFFHNVFSMFDGKRFDLGLYEQGSTHSVTFDRPGVSFIFCNIHPEMSAVVVVVGTPYFAISKGNGEISIADVLPGRYQVSLWCERCLTESTNEFPRVVTISNTGTSLGTIHLTAATNLLQPHKNKYGLDYDPASPGSGIYGGR